MCVFPLLLQLALADTYLGSLSLSSFGSRRPLALTMAGSSGCGGPRAAPGLGQTETSHRRVGTSGLGSEADIVTAVRHVSEGPTAEVSHRLSIITIRVERERDRANSYRGPSAIKVVGRMLGQRRLCLRLSVSFVGGVKRDCRYPLSIAFTNYLVHLHARPIVVSHDPSAL